MTFTSLTPGPMGRSYSRSLLGEVRCSLQWMMLEILEHCKEVDLIGTKMMTISRYVDRSSNKYN